MTDYQKPGVSTRTTNRLLGLVVRLGVSPSGAQLLTVAGRKTGKPMSTPVNPMTFEGGEYLVCPRGNTHWARNLRVAREGQLRVGRERRQVRVTSELADAEKPAVLLAYLGRWGGVTKGHFGITWPNPAEDEIARVCARTPMFRIETAG